MSGNSTAILIILLILLILSLLVCITESVIISVMYRKVEQKNTALINLLSTRDEQRRIENTREEQHKKYMSLAARQAERMAENK